jgi:Ca-activated chloride channel family protein
VRAEKGQTGIDQISRSLSKMMKEELSERVETVFAEAYAWPLGAALLLFIVEAMIPEAPARRGNASTTLGAITPDTEQRRRRSPKRRGTTRTAADEAKREGKGVKIRARA